MFHGHVRSRRIIDFRPRLRDSNHRVWSAVSYYVFERTQVLEKPDILSI